MWRGQMVADMAASDAGTGPNAQSAKLIIHAGFAKAGSTSIQVALMNNASALGKQSVFQIGSDLEIGSGGTPAWTIQDAADQRKSLTRKLIDSLAKAHPGDRIIISSENLQEPNMPALFEGLDMYIDIHIIFYFRHQFDSIPSAWKQWYSKDGTSLQDYIDRCLKKGYPSYLKSVEAWANRLPRAKITVRPLVRNLLLGGGPDSDFLHQIGVDTTNMSLGDIANRSLDFSLIHLMMKNAAQFYTGPHDVRAEQALNQLVGAKSQVPYAPIISKTLKDQIEERFKVENLHLISQYCEHSDPSEIYRLIMQSPRSDLKAYTEMSETEILERAFRILANGVGDQRISNALGNLIMDQVNRSNL